VDGDKVDKWTTPTVTWTGNLLADRADGSGLLYRRNRYYDPVTGRFTQADPIGLAGGLNAYGFAQGDGINFADPLGLCPTCVDDALRAVQPVLETITSLLASGTIGRTLVERVKSEQLAVFVESSAKMAATDGPCDGRPACVNAVTGRVLLSDNRNPATRAVDVSHEIYHGRARHTTGFSQALDEVYAYFQALLVYENLPAGLQAQAKPTYGKIYTTFGTKAGIKTNLETWTRDFGKEYQAYFPLIQTVH
jgi:RHS repeat-associated protein